MSTWCGVIPVRSAVSLRANIAMAQIPSEFYQLMRIVYQKSPKTVLEIGTGLGGTLFNFCCGAADYASIVTIDLKDGAYGGGYPEENIEVYKLFAQRGQRLLLVTGNSHVTTTQQCVKEFLNTKKVDFYFIDGDHSYAGVKQDFEDYLPLMNSRGIVTFHDIVEHDPQTCLEGNVEVKKFWDEIKGNYKHKEFIENPKQGTGGIGVLYLNESK